jgi:hypothetical protein
LDLDAYKPYLPEFSTYSQHLFENDSGVFKAVFKDSSIEADPIPKRTTQIEFNRALKKFSEIKGKESESPKKATELIKKYPPFKNDEISEELIKCFEVKGHAGWQFMTKNIFKEDFTETLNIRSQNNHNHVKINQNHNQK